MQFGLRAPLCLSRTLSANAPSNPVTGDLNRLSTSQALADLVGLGAAAAHLTAALTAKSNSVIDLTGIERISPSDPRITLRGTGCALGEVDAEFGALAWGITGITAFIVRHLVAIVAVFIAGLTLSDIRAYNTVAANG